jgi:serine/threonine protein kinase
MAYLHSLNILHRDLKPANILLSEDFSPRIGDFGLARVIDLESAMKLTIGIGTPLYKAPEMEEEDEREPREWGPDAISGAVDVFSFGIILWELAAEKTPFADYKGDVPFGTRKKIVRGERPKMPGNVTEKMKKLITRCWDEVPEDRPRFDEIVNDPSALLFEEADKAVYNDFCFDLVQSYRV